jgi:hypothetical protein
VIASRPFGGGFLLRSRNRGTIMSYIITLWNALKGKPIWIRGPVVPVNDVVADQKVFGWCFNVETHMVVDFILRPCFIIINDIKIKVYLKAAERMKENDFKVCLVPSRRKHGSSVL